MGIVYGALANSRGKSLEMAQRMKKAYGRKNYPLLQTVTGNLVIGKHKFLPARARETETALFETERLIVAGSIIFDNRAELAEQLGIDGNGLAQLSDAELAGRMYLKCGADCCARFDGLFAIVIYDKLRRRLLFICDQAGGLGLHYFFDGADLYFASTKKQLIELGGAAAEPDVIRLSRLIKEKGIYLVPEQEQPATIYKNIKKIPAGWYAECDVENPAGGLRLVKYYDLEDNIRRLRLRNDREYEEAYLQCLKDAVRSAMCGYTAVASEMSSGFDSTVVSCLAANELKKSNVRLQSYISAPDDAAGLEPIHARHLIDEYPLAKIVADYNGNIDLQRVGQGGGNAWRDMDASFSWLETPVYNLCNLGWIMNLRTTAAGGAKVLLGASMGNMIISCGNYSRSLNQLLNERDWLAAAGLVFDRFWQKPGYASLRAALGGVYRRFCPVGGAIEDKSPLWRDLDGSVRRFAGLDKLSAAFDDYLRLYVHSSVSGIKNTGIALMAETGIIVRDPLRSRKVFEFARALPPEQFAKGFYDRALIRRAAKGLLPDEKRLSYSRGLQGTDWLKRLEPDWDNVLREARTALGSPLVQQLADTDALAELIDNTPALDVADHQSSAVRDILQAVALSRFFGDTTQKFDTHQLTL